MRSAILAALLFGAFGCRTAPSVRQPVPSPLTRGDSARIAAAVLTGIAADSVAYVTLREFFERRDSVEAAKANPRRYVNLRVF